MKLSKLIKKLQAIEAETPFDSDVVTGDDFMPTQLKSVSHEPPYTFIQFDYEEPEENQLTATSKILTFERMTHLSKHMTTQEQAELISWEKEFVTGDGAYGTSDWPGWDKVFVRLSH